ncbi:FCD domain-containing protein [Aurantimonas aggregata]|uniref:FCD domain-containing protein n=1 Tax=Aurantimonas aggregata TaxID=2047720 RepID=A0A6L9MMJ0_9HYPH|nr:FCD domain-containing protein [Aurantimonas aggregata]
MSHNANEPFPFARLMELNEHRPLYPRSLVEMAYEQLLSMLVTMKIPPGAHIGIEALARQLKISQTPIREALTLLEAQKLAYKIPNVGFRAANLLTPEDIDALFEIRLMIEPAMAALAAKRASEEMLQTLVSLSHAMAEAADGNDVAYAQFAEGDARLHHLVATASGNRFIAEAIEGLHVHLHIFRFLVNTNATRKALSEHQVLIDALLARDAAAAEAAMRAHLHASRQRMDSVMTAGGEREVPTEAVETAKPSIGRGRPRRKVAAATAPAD